MGDRPIQHPGGHPLVCPDPPGHGPIYGLDLGADHHNPTCQRVGEKHKHAWTDQHADKLAYVPEDITAGLEEAVAVWREFCSETRIQHNGALEPPPAVQAELPL